MAQERAPQRERPLVPDESKTTSWEAGLPPYRIFRITPTTALGLPGMFGMEQFDQAQLPKPTRWDFGRR